MHKILANTSFLGKDIFYLTECHSTNDVAMSLFRANLAKEGTLVICEHQTKGKGQRGNKWFSQPNMNLTFSLVLRPDFLKPNDQYILNMAVSSAIHEVIYRLTDKVRIKWPNDIVLADGKKLGGLLIENIIGSNQFELSIVGLGLNVNQVVFNLPHAVSLFHLIGKEQNKEKLLSEIVLQIELWYLKLKGRKNREIGSYYLRYLYKYNEWCWFDDGEAFLGKITGINGNGQLELEKQNTENQSYNPKQIKFI